MTNRAGHDDEARAVLAHVLTDALAHHEASGAESLVGWDEHGGATYIDLERAGRVAAQALELVEITEDGRPLFAPRVETALHPRARDAGDALLGGSASPADPVAHLWAVVRRVFPTGAGRHNFLRSQLRQYGYTSPSLSDVNRLSSEQLVTIVRRAEAYEDARTYATSPRRPGGAQ